jgi:hypothetical protein
MDNWKALYRAGGVAALLAALLFRRNIGAEVSLFTGVEAIPRSVAGWFSLLQSRPLIGLAFLAFFDLFDVLLVGLMFLALAAALWPGRKTTAAIALAAGLVGLAVGIAANISLTMLSLSGQYTAAASEVQRASLLAAGQAVLAFNDPLAVYPSTGAFMSLLLVAIAGLLFSFAMLRGRAFGRATALTGFAASVCDLTYCLTVLFAPFLRAYLLAAGGLFWMIWHLLAGLRLLRLSKE